MEATNVGVDLPRVRQVARQLADEFSDSGRILGRLVARGLRGLRE
jgi:hypothetical protein